MVITWQSFIILHSWCSAMFLPTLFFVAGDKGKSNYATNTISRFDVIECRGLG